MNAAARSLSSSTWFRGNAKQMAMTKEGVLAILLLLAVLISAIVVVYTKNEQRLYFNQLQVETQSTQQLNLEWNQLLLEKSAMGAPARVQQIAHDRLSMYLPSKENVMFIQPEASIH